MREQSAKGEGGNSLPRGNEGTVCQGGMREQFAKGEGGNSLPRGNEGTVCQGGMRGQSANEGTREQSAKGE